MLWSRHVIGLRSLSRNLTGWDSHREKLQWERYFTSIFDNPPTANNRSYILWACPWSLYKWQILWLSILWICLSQNSFSERKNEILFWIILMKSSFWSGSQGKYKNNNFIKSWKVVNIVSIRSILSSYLNFRNTVSMYSLHRRAQCPQKTVSTNICMSKFWNCGRRVSGELCSKLVSYLYPWFVWSATYFK